MIFLSKCQDNQPTEPVKINPERSSIFQGEIRLQLFKPEIKFIVIKPGYFGIYTFSS